MLCAGEFKQQKSICLHKKVFVKKLLNFSTLLL